MKATHVALLIVSGFVIASCSSLGQSSYQHTAMEKRACAEAGLTPGTQAFTDCFIKMDAALFNDDYMAGR